MDFFQTAGRKLTAAEVTAGVRHHVALSVVGTERLQDSGYFQAKLAQESLIKSSPIPILWSAPPSSLSLFAPSHNPRRQATRCDCHMR
jgi:uncharacterized protein YbjT (DUF2867 family)